MYDNLSKPYNDIEIIRLRTDYELEKMLSNEPCATAQDYKCRHCEDGCDVLLRKQGIIKTIDDENIEITLLYIYDKGEMGNVSDEFLAYLLSK